MVGVICVFSGCRSVIFKKSETEWKRPDLSGLAFWKKEESKTVPPPPALHFDPAPATGDVRQASSQPARKTAVAPELQQQVDQLTDASKKPLANSTKDLNPLIADAKSKPIRTPNSMSGSTNPSDSLGFNRANSFEPQALKPESKEIASSVEKAQADFNAVIGEKGKQPANTVASKSAALQPLGGALANDFQMPAKIGAAKNQLNAAKNNLDTKLSNVDRAMYDASGNLVTKTKNDLVESVNSFPNKGSVGNESTAELQRVQAEVASAQQQIAELRAQIAASQRPATPVAASTPNQALNTSSTGMNPPVNRVAQLNATNSNSNSNGFTPGLVPANSNGQPGNFSPLQPARNNSASDTGNVLRASTQFSNSGSSTNASQAMFPAPAKAQPSGNYPSTPHSGYSSPATNVGAVNGTNNLFPVQPVGLQAPLGSSNPGYQSAPTVMHAQTTNVQTTNNPTSNAQQFGSTSDAANHVSDVAIPPSVLRGSGSYAPGSVNRLTPNR